MSINFNDHDITTSGNLTANSGNFISLSINNTNITNFNESIDDRINSLLTAGTGINLNYNDSDNSLTINLASVVVTGYEILSNNKSSFTVSQGYLSNNLDVYLNGSKLVLNEDYTASDGTTFVLTQSGVTGDVVEWKGLGGPAEYAELNHSHTSSDITNFNSSVSGLLPTITNSGDNRILTSTGSTVGINAESNLSFDGNLLDVTGSGNFSSGLVISNQTASTIASFDANKNVASLSTSTYPSLTELSYVKGVTSAIQTQIGTKADTSTTVTAGSGLAGGGSLAANLIIDIGQGDGITVSADSIAVDSTVIRTTGVQTMSGAKTFTAATVFSTGVTISSSGTSVPLTITNDGTGNSFVVNDVTGDTSPFVIDSSGNVGIGTSSPVFALQIRESSESTPSDSYISIWGNVAGSNSNIGGIRFYNHQSNPSANPAKQIGGIYAARHGDNYGGSLSFLTANASTGSQTLSTRMFIDSVGNVTIGGAVDPAIKLHVTGNLVASSSNTFAIGISATIPSDATANCQVFRSAPSLQAASFTLDNLRHFFVNNASLGAGSAITTQTGFYAGALSSATINIGFRSDVESASNRWNFYAAGSAPNYFAGNVGIGTTTPTHKFDCNGEFRLRGTGPSAEAGKLHLYWVSDTNRATITTGTSGQIIVETGASSPTARLIITSTGNVGIGTANPQQKFVVSNSGAEGMEIIPALNSNESRIQTYNRSTSAWNKFSINCSTFELFTNGGTTTIFGDSSGNVGIGTSSVSSGFKVDIRGRILSYTTASDGLITVQGLQTASAGTGKSAIQIDVNGNGGFAWQNDASSGTRILKLLENSGYGSGDSELIRVLSGGDVLIGTTTDQGSFRLQVANNAWMDNLYLSTTTNWGRLAINHNGTTTFAAGFNNTDTSSTGQTTVNILRNGTSVGSISTTNAATSYNTNSDYRLKNNVTNMVGASVRLLSLRPVTFEWKVGGSGEGFIAHELAEAVPLAVTGEKDAKDSYGMPIMQSVDHSKLVPLLVSALQEAYAEIANIKSRLSSLEQK